MFTTKEQTAYAIETLSEMQVERWVCVGSMQQYLSVSSHSISNANLFSSYIVQYLLILGQYLQKTQKSVQAWATHGLAISAAYQLDLHSPDANRGFSPLECEIRKRTWYGCILLDRYVSLYPR